jgi:hypothetical protein
MKTKLMPILAAVFSLLVVPVLWAQDLGPQIKQIKDGIYVYVGKNLNSKWHYSGKMAVYDSGIILPIHGQSWMP